MIRLDDCDRHIARGDDFLEPQIVAVEKLRRLGRKLLRRDQLPGFR